MCPYIMNLYLYINILKIFTRQLFSINIYKSMLCPDVVSIKSLKDLNFIAILIR